MRFIYKYLIKKYLFSSVFFKNVVFLSLLTSCAYQIGNSTRNMPGGYRLISIPMFKNNTMETGVETFFTSALSQEFHRSKVGQVVPVDQSELKLIGEISSLTVVPTIKKAAGDSAVQNLPQGAVLNTEYKVVMKVSVRVIKMSDQTEIWAGQFDGARNFTGAQVSMAGVNSVNPIYNLSAKRQVISLIANDLMAEAHDRMTENF